MANSREAEDLERLQEAVEGGWDRLGHAHQVLVEGLELCLGRDPFG